MPPMWRGPVGDGANLTRVFLAMSIVFFKSGAKIVKIIIPPYSVKAELFY